MSATPNITYRKASIADCPTVAKVHVRSWRESFAGLVPETVMNQITVGKRIKAFQERFKSDSYQMYVAESDGDVIGFVDWGSPRQEIKGYEAELYAIFLLPESQGSGVGRQLFSLCVQGMAKSGMRSMYLLTFENSPYRSFYDKMGGRVIKKMDLEIEGMMFDTVVYVWDIGTS